MCGVGGAFFFFAAFTPYDQYVANVLNCGRGEGLAQFIHQGFALFALAALHLDLDELMGLKCALDLGYDGRGETVAGDRYDRVEMVGSRAQVAALNRGEFDH